MLELNIWLLTSTHFYGERDSQLQTNSGCCWSDASIATEKNCTLLNNISSSLRHILKRKCAFGKDTNNNKTKTSLRKGNKSAKKKKKIDSSEWGKHRSSD